jgi:predicted nuclease with TOPRIM domain
MLKMLMKPLKKMRRVADLEENREKIEEKLTTQKKEIENLVNDWVHNLLLKIDRDFDL